MKLFIFLFFLFSLRAWGEFPVGAEIRSSYYLREKPEDEASQKGSMVEVEDVVLFLGVSANGRWAKVMKDSGEVGWVPRDFVANRDIQDSLYRDLIRRFHMKNRVKSRLAFNLGGSYVSQNYGPAGFIEAALNLSPRGVFQNNTDQLEIFLGGAYHYNFQSLVGSVEIPAGIHWMMRPPFSNGLMVGLSLGLSYWKLPVEPPKATDVILEYGVELRYYFTDHFGLMAQGLVLERSPRAYEMGLGISLRH